jgi:hypothetical protein
MFPLPADVALELAHERIADDHRKADQRRRAVAARAAQNTLRARLAHRLFGRVQPVSTAEIRIADAHPARRVA